MMGRCFPRLTHIREDSVGSYEHKTSFEGLEALPENLVWFRTASVNVTLAGLMKVLTRFKSNIRNLKRIGSRKIFATTICRRYSRCYRIRSSMSIWAKRSCRHLGWRNSRADWSIWSTWSVLTTWPSLLTSPPYYLYSLHTSRYCRLRWVKVSGWRMANGRGCLSLGQRP